MHPIQHDNAPYLSNSIKYKDESGEVWRQRQCASEVKKLQGMYITHGLVDENGVDFSMALSGYGWSEDMFNEYLDMLRYLNPRFIPMLRMTTFDRPSIHLTDVSGVIRYMCFCFFRAIWEMPVLAFQLLRLYKADTEQELHPFDYSIYGGVYARTVCKEGHWFGFPNPRQPELGPQPVSKIDPIYVYYNHRGEEIEQVQDELGFRTPFMMNKAMLRTDATNTVVEVVELTDRLFWKEKGVNRDEALKK